MGGCTGTADQCGGQANLICYFPGLVVVSFNLESGVRGTQVLCLGVGTFYSLYGTAGLLVSYGLKR